MWFVEGKNSEFLFVAFFLSILRLASITMNKKLLTPFLFLSIFAGCTGEPTSGNGNQTSFEAKNYNGDINKGFDYWIQAHCHECHGTDMNQGLSPIDPRD